MLIFAPLVSSPVTYTETLISTGAGAIISNSFTNTSNSFDGDNSTFSYKLATSGWIGKDWGVGNTKWVTQYAFKGGRHSSAVNWTGNQAATISIYLYGSNSAPASYADGTLLSSHASTPNTPSTAYEVSNTGLAENFFRYHWLAYSASVAEFWCEDIVWYENVAD
jgi:hypothetical protein